MLFTLGGILLLRLVPTGMVRVLRRRQGFVAGSRGETSPTVLISASIRPLIYSLGTPRYISVAMHATILHRGICALRHV